MRINRYNTNSSRPNRLDAQAKAAYVLLKETSTDLGAYKATTVSFRFADYWLIKATFWSHDKQHPEVKENICHEVIYEKVDGSEITTDDLAQIMAQNTNGGEYHWQQPTADSQKLTTDEQEYQYLEASRCFRDAEDGQIHSGPGVIRIQKLYAMPKGYMPHPVPVLPIKPPDNN